MTYLKQRKCSKMNHFSSDFVPNLKFKDSEALVGLCACLKAVSAAAVTVMRQQWIQSSVNQSADKRTQEQEQTLTGRSPSNESFSSSFLFSFPPSPSSLFLSFVFLISSRVSHFSPGLLSSCWMLALKGIVLRCNTPGRLGRFFFCFFLPVLISSSPQRQTAKLALETSWIHPPILGNEHRLKLN